MPFLNTAAVAAAAVAAAAVAAAATFYGAGGTTLSLHHLCFAHL